MELELYIVSLLPLNDPFEGILTFEGVKDIVRRSARNHQNYILFNTRGVYCCATSRIIDSRQSVKRGRFGAYNPRDVNALKTAQRAKVFFTKVSLSSCGEFIRLVFLFSTGMRIVRGT